ncbi:hypothetical protein KL86DES1_22153 [uncultured Desulfovibrio sp.]|uniref:Uncharacterized protein n=1 Tax=uncultured Desulfovibrio sp. TaxID=167968 RepID=A0A212LBD0_9BACT|nr:hypothetical protein KL86DES1_22153 [uncultured Desulfovibrio sp.]VZH35047.1 conserved protein of unknown function [Desulfovibrio sp. 86]
MACGVVTPQAILYGWDCRLHLYTPVQTHSAMVCCLEDADPVPPVQFRKRFVIHCITIKVLGGGGVGEETLFQSI